MRAQLIAIALALTGCSMIKTSSSTSGTTPGAGPSGPSGSSASGGGGMHMITMPNLVGMTEDEAAGAVKAAGFSAEMEQSSPVECDNPPVEDKVKCQSPQPGTQARSDMTVQVQVHHEHISEAGRSIQRVKTLVGMTPDAAKAKIKSWGKSWTVKIKPPTNSGDQPIYDAKCGENKVCGVNEGADYDEVGVILYVNAKVSVGAPPPPP
jgi:hypothetical protein